MHSQQVAYQIINNKCEAALIDFHFHDEGITWIIENKNLFDTIHVHHSNITKAISNKCTHLAIFYNTYIDALVVFAAAHDEKTNPPPIF